MGRLSSPRALLSHSKLLVFSTLSFAWFEMGRFSSFKGFAFPFQANLRLLCCRALSRLWGSALPWKQSYGRRFPWSSYPSMRYIDLHIEWFSLCIVCFPRATLWPSAFSSHMAAFYWCHVALQLWRYYLRMLNHTFVEISFPQGFIFTKDVYLQSLLRLFDMEGLFVVFSSLSFDYLEWGRLIVCSIFFCALSSMLFRTHFAFYITFHFFRCSTCFFHAYFAWGRAII